MFATTVNLFNTYRGIFTLEKGPQHLPTSYALLVTMLCAYTLARFGVEQFENDPAPAFLMALIDTAMSSGIILAILWARGVAHRAPQMLTAFAGIGAGFGLAMIVALGAISIGNMIGVPLVQGFVNVVTFPFILVNVVINGHLFRATVSVTLAVGVLMALVLMFLVVNVTNRFDPHLMRAPQEAGQVTPSPQMSTPR
jgi:ethanolamine transporter EutH